MPRLRKSGTALVAALSLSLMLAPVAQAQGADVYGVGGGWVGVGADAKFITFAFSGHTGPQGDFGSFKWTQHEPAVPLELRVDLDCVNVFSTATGAAGWLQGQVDRVSPDPNVFGIDEGEEVMFYIEDNGEPSDPLAHEIAGAFFQIAPQTCKTLTGTGGFPITNGNINIKLESLLP